jgi:hypothetical protein
VTRTGLLDKPAASACRTTPAAAFASSSMVSAAAALFQGSPIRERVLGCTLVPAGERISGAMSRELWPERFADKATGELLPDHLSWTPRVGGQIDHEMLEGPQWRIMVGPGKVSVRRQDPVRRERALQREACRKSACGDPSHHHAVFPEYDGDSAGACITEWSSKSRAKMVETINDLDLSDFVARGDAAGLTLTYPGDWLAVAPDAAIAQRQVDAFRGRYRRRFGVRLDGLWKREFQDRRANCPACLEGSHEHPDSGRAPHYHVWTVKPVDVDWRTYRDWVASAWASVVGAASCGRPAAECQRSCERHRHESAGTGVERYAGRRASDPNTVAVYFSKHGAFAAKDYQNVAPAEWVEQGRVGRYWGYWGLEKAVAGVLVSADDAHAAARVLRRHSRANSYVAAVPAWKYRTLVDLDTGEITARWRKGRRKIRVYRMHQNAGYVVTRSGPSLAADVARALDAQRAGPPRGRAGSGPIGFLP